MKKYVLLIGDGNGAASRGTEGEVLYTFKCEAEDIDDAINKCQDEIRDMDRFDNWSEVDDEYDSYSDYFNDKDPSGGDIWLIAYLEDGNLVDCYDLELLKSGKDNSYEFNNYDDAELFGMEPYVEDNRW